MARKANPKAAARTGGGGKPPTWDTIMPLPSNPKTGETANDYYILDCEVHVMPENYRRFIKYFPGTKTFEYAHKMCNWWQWVDHRSGKQAAIHPGMDWHIDKIMGDMDRSGVDQITLMRESFIDTSGDSAPFSTNQHVIDAIEKYPDRVIGISNVGPFSKRKIKDVLWELEYLHDNYNFKFTKFYQPEDCPMNDRRLWPVYEMCQAKGIVCYFHTGITIRMGPTRYTQPILLDDVAMDFPDLKIVAYHGGYPYWEDLVMLMWKHPHIYVSYSILLPWLMRAPHRFAHMVGTTLQIAGYNRFVWGSDWPASDPYQAVEAVLKLEIDEELQEKWGYPPITKELKAEFLGLTLARLAGIDPKKNQLDFPGRNQPPKGKTAEGDVTRRIMAKQKKG
ncbi:MAG: amidohydrolase family protein [Candidatus Tectomicrobia bacterium]|uniref:Amidohydrolase family protein n=1 Tax=Tectimicrobiota bacterium TaxID=2528274 RepID=A0A932I3A8_UNCTE|nr:amidohydrolase family protein [Candidatus Tectomicrobia bacterium]